MKTATNMKTYTSPQFPGKTFRRLKVGERVQKGDCTNAKSNDQESGWVEAGSHAGREVQSSDWLFYYREVSETNDSTTMKHRDTFTLWGVQEPKSGQVLDTYATREIARSACGKRYKPVKLECRIVPQSAKKPRKPQA